MSSYLKDPDEVLDYLIDYSSRLVSGETIQSVEIVAPAGITVAPTGHPTTHTDSTVTVWLAGGIVGSRLNIVGRVTTSGGRVKEQAIRVRIIDRAGVSTVAPPGGSGGGEGTFDMTGTSVVDNGDGSFTLTAA